MSTLPAKLLGAISEPVRLILSPSAHKISAGLLALTEAAMRGRAKSKEENLLDIVHGEIELADRRDAAIDQLRKIAKDPNFEHQRILAREASRFVLPENLIMPAVPIAGKIFRDSEFDEEGTPIWDMWAQLLARACDRTRVDQAHPAFTWIISQLSGDEAKILKAAKDGETAFGDVLKLRLESKIRSKLNKVIKNDLNYPQNGLFYVSHIEALGLLHFMGYNPPDDWPVFYILKKGQINGHIGFTSVGNDFLRAVSDNKL